jgi:hypothetical protein
MHPNSIKGLVSAAWLLAMGATGFFANVTSFSGWAVLASCAIVPPLVMTQYWKQPDPTLSESIQQALR